MSNVDIASSQSQRTTFLTCTRGGVRLGGLRRQYIWIKATQALRSAMQIRIHFSVMRCRRPTDQREVPMSANTNVFSWPSARLRHARGGVGQREVSDKLTPEPNQRSF